MSAALTRENVKLGYLPSPHGVVDAYGKPITGSFAGSRLLAGMGTKLDPRAIDLFPFHRERIQQVNNCVSHGFANLLQVLMWIRAQKACPLLSVAYSYAGAQHLWSPGEFPDTGSSLELTLKWWRDHGVISEAAYPENYENCTQLPPDDLWQRGAAATVTGCHRIDDGDSAPDLICANLALAEEGITSSCTVVVVADDKMGALARDGVYDSPGGAAWGGHCLGVGSYAPQVGPSGAFGIFDTWGRFRFYMTREYVARYARDLIVMEAGPAAEVVQ